MKKIYSLIAVLALMLCSSAYISANVLNINGVDQQVDTIIPKHQVGPGTTYAFYHCPNRPLTIHVLEVDLTNPYVQMEVCDGGQKSVATETPSSMYARNDAPGHAMVAVFNGDFFHTTSTDATATGMSRMGLISNGECILNPVGYPMFVLSDERIAYTELLYFNATLSTATSSTRIHTLNSHALEFDASDDSERMILYTNAYGTKTNNTSAGTSIVIAPKEGDAFNFADNCTISCIVESSVDNAASSTIPTGKAILYGTGSNATFLKTLAVGDECTINISNTMPAQAAVKNIKEALGGSGHFIIQNGEVVISTTKVAFSNGSGLGTASISMAVVHREWLSIANTKTTLLMVLNAPSVTVCLFSQALPLTTTSLKLLSKHANTTFPLLHAAYLRFMATTNMAFSNLKTLKA